MAEWRYYDGGDPPVYRPGLRLYNDLDETEDVYWEEFNDIENDRDTAYMMEAHLSKPNEWGGIKHEN